MNQENLMLMQKPSRISTNQQVANTHIIQIWEDIGFPDEFREELNLINNASELDTIVLDLCTDGGVLDTAMLFNRALRSTAAHTVAIIGPSCSSAGSVMALSCKEFVLDETSSLMCHTSSYRIGGKDTDILEHANFSRKQLRSLYANVYSGFLSPEEIEDVIKGTPFYFDADQLADRLDSLEEYRQSKPCECQNCIAQDEETEDNEPMPTLQQMIAEAVAEGVKSELDRREKAERKRSSKEATKSSDAAKKKVDQSKEISEYLEKAE